MVDGLFCLNNAESQIALGKEDNEDQPVLRVKMNPYPFFIHPSPYDHFPGQGVKYV